MTRMCLFRLALRTSSRYALHIIRHAPHEYYIWCAPFRCACCIKVCLKWCAANVCEPCVQELTLENYKAFFADFMKMKRSRDLSGLMKPLVLEMTWKIHPRPTMLTNYADLIKIILLIEPRGILSDLLIKQSILAEDAQERMFVIT